MILVVEPNLWSGKRNKPRGFERNTNHKQLRIRSGSGEGEGGSENRSEAENTKTWRVNNSRTLDSKDRIQDYSGAQHPIMHLVIREMLLIHFPF